jgi:hypothetical protein
MAVRARHAFGFAACMLAGAAAFVPAGVRAAPLNRAEFLALSHSIGRVEAQLEDGRLGVGSAITVADGILVTNCHVTARAVAIKVIGGGMAWPVAEQVADVAHDVCFLRLNEWPSKPVLLRGARPLHVGDVVSAMGYTALAMTLRIGEVTALHAHDGAQIIETDTAFTSGASGGGLFDDEGALVGMLTFRMRGSNGHYFAVPMQWIRERLPRETQWTPVAPLVKGRPFWAGEIEQLPLFMRAATLQEQGRWSDLRSVAEYWTAQDPDNAEAYLALGIALGRLVAPEAAVDSLSRAVALAPKNPVAWFNLGLAYRTTGNRGALRRVVDTLAELDEPLASRLRNEAQSTLSTELNP